MVEIKLGKQWLNGRVQMERQIGSKLLLFEKGERFQCCVGCALTQLGIPDEVLLDKGYLHDLLNRFLIKDSFEVPDALKFMLFDETLSFRVGVGSETSETGNRIYRINDSVNFPGAQQLTDSERVELLNKVSEPHGLRFVLEN